MAICMIHVNTRFVMDLRIHNILNVMLNVNQIFIKSEINVLGMYNENNNYLKNILKKN